MRRTKRNQDPRALRRNHNLPRWSRIVSQKRDHSPWDHSSIHVIVFANNIESGTKLCGGIPRPGTKCDVSEKHNLRLFNRFISNVDISRILPWIVFSVQLKRSSDSTSSQKTWRIYCYQCVRKKTGSERLLKLPSHQRIYLFFSITLF